MTDSAGISCLPSVVNVSADYVSFLAWAVLQPRGSVFFVSFFFRLAVCSLKVKCIVVSFKNSDLLQKGFECSLALVSFLHVTAVRNYRVE